LRDGNRHNFSCFTKISDRPKVICEQCSFAKLLWRKFVLKRHQNNFLKWSKYNLGELEGRSLKIGKRKCTPSYKSVVCNHVLNTIRNIIRDTYIYVKPMYNINFCIIVKTYIHMQSPSHSTLTLILSTYGRKTLIPILETQGRN